MNIKDIKDVWYNCPVCGQKLLKINPSKKIEGVYIKCKRCRQEVEIINEPEPERCFCKNKFKSLKQKGGAIYENI